MQRTSSKPRPSQPQSIYRELVRRKARQLRDSGLLDGLRRPLPDAAGPPGGGESAWSRRYNEAARCYEGLDLGRQEAVKAVIEGLHEWARLAPQRSVRQDGVPEPANKWGLGAERCMLRAFNSHLVAIGQPLLASRIRSEMADLLQTAEALDECCFELPPGSDPEKRLVATARIQTKALVKLLSAVQLEPNAAAKDGSAPRRKRGHPPAQDPAKDRGLMEEWAQVRGKAGMSRKEFCRLKDISFKDFIQAQDRFRKQAAQAAARDGPQTEL